MKSTKVLHVLHAFSHGGLENGLVNIINASPPELEHELCLLTEAGEFMTRLHKPVRYYELHKKPGNSVGTIQQLRRVIRESGAGIVHTRNWGAFDGVIASCLCPGIVLLHGEHGRDISDPEGSNRRRNLFRRLFSPRIGKYTAVSDDLKRWLANRIGIPESKIVLIRNGVDTGRFRPNRDWELRKALGIPKEQFVIGAIGRLDPVKNYPGLIRAFAQIAQGNRDVRLVIVGDGPQREELEKLITELDISARLILIGYRSDVERFYGLIDVFVLNSFAEGMSNTLLEAMSSGLPVICTPVGANPDLVADGLNGRLVPAGDDLRLAEALEEYSASPEKRTDTGTAARELVVNEYSLSLMVNKYIELYCRLGRARK